MCDTGMRNDAEEASTPFEQGTGGHAKLWEDRKEAPQRAAAQADVSAMKLHVQEQTQL